MNSTIPDTNIQELSSTTESCDESHDIHDFFSMNYLGNEISHYNPLREDFEVEPDNDAEKCLTVTSLILGDESSVDQEEDELMKHLVLAMVDSYWRRLIERDRIKKIVKEHGLINIYHLLGHEKMLSLTEQLVKRATKSFLRFQTSHQGKKLEQSFLYELQLKEKIKKLQNYRRLGLKTLKSIDVYERLKKRREKMKEKKIKAFNKIQKEEESFFLKANLLSTESLSQKQRPSVTPLDITLSPGVDLLDDDEKDLCSTHRVFPDVYCHCKNQILAEYKKLGYIRLMDARKLCRIDVNKTRRIFNLLLKKGFIKTCK